MLIEYIAFNPATNQADICGSLNAASVGEAERTLSAQYELCWVGEVPPSRRFAATAALLVNSGADASQIQQALLDVYNLGKIAGSV